MKKNLADENELVQYYVVNNDLIKTYNMSSGKIGAQIGHASRLSCDRDRDKPLYKEWFNHCMKTVVLKGSEKELLKLEAQGFIPVRDNGLTEIPRGSLTVVVLDVMTRIQAKSFVKKLQLL